MFVITRQTNMLLSQRCIFNGKIRFFLCIVPMMLAYYMTIFSENLFTPTAVIENAPAKLIGINYDNNDLQVVVVAPMSGRLFLIERPRASYWYAYQWPELTHKNDIVNVCYTTTYESVDIDCNLMRWKAFFINVAQGSWILLLLFMIGTLAAFFIASFIDVFRTQTIYLSTCDNNGLLINDIEHGPLTKQSDIEK